MYSWLLVLVFLMAGGGSKRPRTTAQQGSAPAQEEEGSEYVPGEDSGHDSPDEAVQSARTETRSKRKEKQKAIEQKQAKGKGKLPVSAHGDDQATYVRARKRTGGISIREPGEAPPPRAPPRDAPQDVPQDAPAPLDPKRVRMYASKTCVGERFVGVENIVRRVPGFQALFETGNLHAVCDFRETHGYGLELIREFYLRGGNLVETEGGPYQFTTSVRGTGLLITPEIIGHVLEMPAYTGGVEYMHAGLDAVQDWKRVLNALCVEGAENNGVAIFSKDLRIEYRFLNFVVCYNVMPLANTKSIRWDRVLYMYLLGRPNLIQEKNLNVNIPFLIWKRMAREIKTANLKDRLPYPLLIMRILRLHDVDVTCPYYEHCLGPISDSTIVKSHAQLHGIEPPVPEAPAPPSPARTEASISSVYREQQRLSGEIERLASDNAQIVANQSQLLQDQAIIRQDQSQLISDVDRLNKRYGKISKFLRLLCTKLGCGSSEMPSLGSDSE